MEEQRREWKEIASLLQGKNHEMTSYFAILVKRRVEDATISDAERKREIVVIIVNSQTI